MGIFAGFLSKLSLTLGQIILNHNYGKCFWNTRLASFNLFRDVCYNCFVLFCFDVVFVVFILLSFLFCLQIATPTC